MFGAVFERRCALQIRNRLISSPRNMHRHHGAGPRQSPLRKQNIVRVVLDQ